MLVPAFREQFQATSKTEATYGFLTLMMFYRVFARFEYEESKINVNFTMFLPSKNNFFYDLVIVNSGSCKLFLRSEFCTTINLNKILKLSDVKLLFTSLY